MQNLWNFKILDSPIQNPGFTEADTFTDMTKSMW